MSIDNADETNSDFTPDHSTTERQKTVESHNTMDDTQSYLYACIVCEEGAKKGMPLNYNIDCVIDIVKSCEERVSLGDSRVLPLYNRLLDFQECNYENIAYHRKCRQTIVHKWYAKDMKERNTLPPKIPNVSGKRSGRPQKSNDSEKPKRIKTTPKEEVCLFSSCKFCPKNSDSLHQIVTTARGQSLLDLKENTNDNFVRTSLSELIEPGDAAALEKYYHRDCIRNAQRTCEIKKMSIDLKRILCDDELLLNLSEHLTNYSDTVSIIDVNDAYIEILAKYNVEINTSKDYRKYLKHLVSEKLPDIAIIRSHRAEKPAQFAFKSTVSESMKMRMESLDDTEKMNCLKKASKVLRDEILNNRDWTFEGKFDDYKLPSFTQFFMTRLLLGNQPITGPSQEYHNAVNICCQVLAHNLKTNKQVKHKPKTENHQRNRTETPLSIALPLSIHSRIRDKIIIQNLCSVNLGSHYRNVIALEKRIEQGMLRRMQTTGGFCLPDFIKKNVRVRFAIDNIDLLEDTPTGQNSFHGTVMVIFQEDVPGDCINGTLTIPTKLSKPSEQLHMVQEYEPLTTINKTKPIKFESFQYTNNTLQSTVCYTRTWALAAHLSRADEIEDETGERSEINDSLSMRDLLPTYEIEDDYDEQQSFNDLILTEEIEGMIAESVNDNDQQSMSDSLLTYEIEDETNEQHSVNDLLQTDEVADTAEHQSINDPLQNGQKECLNEIHSIPITIGHPSNLHSVEICDDTVTYASPSTAAESTNSPLANDNNMLSNTNTISIQRKGPKEKKPEKRCVMPTWAATKSLLSSVNISTTNHYQTNIEVVAPLFRTSPTDYTTLYNALKRAQGISAYVVGSNRTTIITLDLDLYVRALHIQQTTGNSNWFLRLGELHIGFAELHALGKTIDGSGIDICAIETGAYTSATLRKIFDGKHYKRGVEFHITLALSILMMQFEHIISDDRTDLVSECTKFRRALHKRNPEISKIYENIQSVYESNIQPKEKNITSEMATFLIKYLEQVDCFLHLVMSCRSGDFQGYLVALEKTIKYFFAHNLLNYARLMPIHLAQLKALEKEDILTWEAFESGEFVVTKSDIPFTKVFTDQSLEQEIKVLKGQGGIVGITQKEEDCLDRLLLTSPYILKLVKRFNELFPSSRDPKRKEHYQLSGQMPVRIITNAVKICETIKLHCEGNPFSPDCPLKNIASSKLLPDDMKKDILQFAEKGQLQFEKFVDERLLLSSPASV